MKAGMSPRSKSELPVPGRRPGNERRDIMTIAAVGAELLFLAIVRNKCGTQLSVYCKRR